MIPLHISLKGKKIVIAGGGTIACRKLNALLHEKAEITIVSPKVHEKMEKLISEHSLEWKQKEIEKSDLASAFLIIAATNQPHINQWIGESASENQLVNVASNADYGNIYLPKTIKKGKILISVSTSGASPADTKKIAGAIEDLISEELIEAIEIKHKARRSLEP
ncbi:MULTISPECIES: NAD(P)-dependent oxidoreductase [Bacillus]|uniref:precorrin-2 dehydrogenase n=2 Tax=Bacillus TaxID=1386 RepID=A0A0M4FID5_9BACI|nr:MULTISPECIES: NAD(P)-dependent oxidoreductase [Bacillus]ALC81004.1 precorrin-2 dehydrogenase [Bacillus gobiensis]MBP1079958.1 precorrin-2 dehydrogenase/sirohydrochlorin ferrochelatase [Bacillus capparidis]MED1095345.1 NAD(P)-dependent oxidoreductase [Bacillus capparidis]